MGAINQAFNQAAGALAGAGLAIKHAKETEESKTITAENAALVARNQEKTAYAEVNAAYQKAKEDELPSKLKEAQKAEDEAMKAYDKSMKRKNGSQKTRQKKYTELQAAQQAKMTLQEKAKAINDMMNRYEEQRVNAIKATELAEKAKQKYQSRWGGIK